MPLTKEEKRYIEQLKDFWSAISESERSLITIIDRLVAENEELRTEFADKEEAYELLIDKTAEVGERDINKLQRKLTAVIKAAEPIVVSLQKMEAKSELRPEPDEFPITGMGRSIHDVPTMGDFRNLSKAVKEAKG